ncbi:tRNA uridine-5-carboxymethylaminomethyl(34) synthesis GTPase MnmE [Rhodobacteraceae bacterium CCMM004]|nr:tRNA uridine-5-carboxymethylaminomethyl(34) synthesis GTPase MnmE [Rhodobacteraceae bacterium CCMM004]
METIFAQASALGKAGVAVIRISGPQAFAAGRALAGTLPAPKTTGLRTLRDGAGSIIDAALVLPFAAGASFTGEETVELHVHGSVAVCRAVLDRLGQIEGLRPAAPGEFTRRALANGRMDLTQVEGLADLIDAETEAQRRQAMRIHTGELSRLIAEWRDDLESAIALVEATIDFADEEVPDDLMPHVQQIVDRVETSIATHLGGAAAARSIASGFEVAIVGAPNVGKSTLLNRLAGREAALTSEIAGTTRDVVEVRMDMGGLAVTLLDTAGLRETEDTIETLGIARAVERANGADLRVFLRGNDAETVSVERQDDDIQVVGKADLRSGVGGGVSGLTGAGVDELVSEITEVLRGRVAGASLATRDRHAEALRQGADALSTFRNDCARDAPPEILAEDLREAARALDVLLGRIDVEDILGRIFSRFCIGK